jgi:hypothetical protein
MSIRHDLYGHQGQADAGHWRALEGVPAARTRQRLPHIHSVPRGFLWVERDQSAPIVRAKPEHFVTRL